VKTAQNLSAVSNVLLLHLFNCRFVETSSLQSYSLWTLIADLRLGLTIGSLKAGGHYAGCIF